MSVGQSAGGVVGAVAGFFIGGPVGALKGASLGYTVGGIIDPPPGPKQEPPETKDLTVQTATYGASRPRLYGTITVYANIFWLENNLIKMVVKKTKQGGGKGGGKKTTVKTKTYYGTFAAGLCDCPSAPIVGIKRIWLVGKLWYDSGSTDQNTIRASNDASTLFTLHNGSDTQLADDRMQATLGIANTPAYRGLAYIVFKDLPLAPYGDTLMGLQIKVEVICSGTVSTNVLSFTEPGFNQVITGGAWFRNQFYLFEEEASQGNYAVSPTGDPGTWVSHSLPAGAVGTNYAVSCAKTSKYLFATVSYQGGVWRTKDGNTWIKPAVDVRSCYWGVSSYGDNIIYMPREYFGDGYYSTDGGDTWKQTANAMAPYGSILSRGMGCNNTHAILTSYIYNTGAERVIHILDFDTGVLTKTRIPDGLGITTEISFSKVEWFPDINQWVLITQGNVVVLLSGDLQTWTAAASFPGGYSGPYYASGKIWTSTNSTQYSTPDMVTWTQVGAGYPTIGVNCYGLLYNDAIGLYYGSKIFSDPWHSAMQIRLESVSSTDVTLASIVSAEVLQSKVLAAGDIDVTLLASQAVRGYKVSNVAAIRSALEPLQGAWPFDVVHHGYKLQFKPRGTTSVVTIPEVDLDARSAGDAPGVALTSVREMDSVLPQRVTMQYLDYSREYDVNTQYAERLNTDAVNVQSLDLALVLTADEAARIVEVLLYMYWMDRYSLKFSIPAAKYNNLEPGDVVTVVTSTGSYVLRLTQITYTADGLLDCDAKYSRSATYTSTAVGGTPVAVPVTLALPGDSALELLDIPLLDDSMNQAGFVAAMTGYSSGWTGGEIYRTDDGGASWSDLQAFAAQGSEIGYAFNSIGAGRTDIFDNASVLQVYFVNDATFSSVTELAVLNGSNYFAYGVHGRWEIIAAKTCSLQADGSYLLSDLLRGRKGTEWACGLHVAGDTVVALDNTSVIFVGASTSLIGVDRTYRGVTDGQTIDAASDYAFTYTGVNLECYAPVYVNGDKNASGDWNFTWIPRTRVGGEWRDYVDATMVEASESYIVTIYSSNTYTTVKRTLTVSIPAATYTGAFQVADFTVGQPHVYIDVRQVSAIVGDGYPARGDFIASDSDPLWGSVVLSMPMDVAGFVDLKSHTVTVAGSAAVSATQSLTGGYSGYFDGVDDRLSFAATSDWDLSSGNFAFEWDMYPTSMPTIGNQCRLFLIGANGSASAFYVGFDNSGVINAYVPSGSPSGLSTSAGAVVVNTHNTFELSVSSGTARLFKNGALIAGPSTMTLPSSSSGNQLFIGWDTVATVDFKYTGYLDRVRLTKATRHTASFVDDLIAFPIY